MLVTEGENVGVLAMVRGLERAGYAPWVASAHRNAPAARSRAVAGAVMVPDPAASGRAFGEAIAGLAQTLEPVAILPGGEQGLLALAELAESGPPLPARLGVCPVDTVNRATDKAALTELAACAGLKTPETAIIDAEQAACGPLPVSLPLIVKPIRSQIPVNGGYLSYSVSLARTRAELVKALSSMPDDRGLVQQYAPGRLSGVGGVFWRGKIVAAVHQQAHRTFPIDCGQMSYAVSVARDPELERQIAVLLNDLGWRGLFQVQFMDTDQGRLLIDINPRVYGSLSLALAVGQNLPGIWVDLLRGRRVSPGPYRSGVLFRNEFLDARALLAEARHAQRPVARQPAPAGETAHAFFEAGDPMPLMSLAPALAGKLGARVARRCSLH